MTPTDEELVARIAQGDVAAFSQFYDRHAATIHALILGWIRRRADAEEVLQDAMMQIWTQANRFDAARASARGWLMMIARSRALDHLRRTARGGASPIDPPPEANAPESDPSRGHTRSELTTLVQKALDGLPPDQASAVSLAFFAGLTHERIADLQGIPLGTIKTRIRLGMRRLRDMAVLAREASTS